MSDKERNELNALLGELDADIRDASDPATADARMEARTRLAQAWTLKLESEIVLLQAQVRWFPLRMAAYVVGVASLAAIAVMLIVRF